MISTTAFHTQANAPKDSGRPPGAGESGWPCEMFEASGWPPHQDSNPLQDSSTEFTAETQTRPQCFANDRLGHRESQAILCRARTLPKRLFNFCPESTTDALISTDIQTSLFVRKF